MNVQPVHDCLPVLLHGFDAYRQHVGYAPAGISISDQFQNLGMAFGQGGRTVGSYWKPRYWGGWSEESTPSGRKGVSPLRWPSRVPCAVGASPVVRRVQREPTRVKSKADLD